MTHRLRRDDKLTGLSGAYNGTVKFRHDRLDIPMRRKKPTVFALWTDLFHEDINYTDIGLAFDFMSLCHKHTFLVLTKRAQRQREILTDLGCAFPNVWIGVTVCNRSELGKLDDLRATPSAHRYVSFEPILEDLVPFNPEGIDLVICGPETGQGRRPFAMAWAASVAVRCRRAGIPFFFKGDGGDQKELPWRS